MKKHVKREESKAKNLQYISGEKNTELRQALWSEQKGFCAYTETYLGRSDQKDIDHFNPSKDFTERNYYSNLFLCKSQWNKEKSDKWNSYQPILHPCSHNFSDRIVYNKDLKLFEASNSEDQEAKNLVSLLKLDDHDLAVERKKYIDLCSELMGYYDNDPVKYFGTVIKTNVSNLQFVTSLEKEFNINVWEMIPEIN
jgi:hypothetical protein